MTILRTATDILRCFNSDCRSITVTDVARKLDVPKSRASRTLKAMLECGLLERTPESLAYRPGALLGVAGRIYRDAHSLFNEADGIVRRISVQTGHTGYVSQRTGTTVMGISDHPGTHVLRVISSVGRPLDASASATGRALLALLPDDTVRALFRSGLNPPSPSAPQTMDELLARLADVRSKGYAESNDEANRGVGALAVSIGETAADALALCIAFPAATVPEEEKRAIVAALQSETRRFSETVVTVPPPETVAKAMAS